MDSIPSSGLSSSWVFHTLVGKLLTGINKTAQMCGFFLLVIEQACHWSCKNDTFNWMLSGGDNEICQRNLVFLLGTHGRLGGVCRRHSGFICQMQNVVSIPYLDVTIRKGWHNPHMDDSKKGSSIEVPVEALAVAGA